MNSRVLAVTSVAFLAAFCSAGNAASRDDVLEQLAKCASVADNTARLVCYDAMSPHVKDALATPPTALDHSPTQDEQKSWFGFNLDNLFGSAPEQQTTPDKFGNDRLPSTEQKKEAAEQEVDSITAVVTDYSFSLDGRFVVFLDNGQVWRQIQGDTGQAHFKRSAKDNTVSIQRGMFGSYDLNINDANKTFKVTRVK
ncbi:MAG TPA: hypothetical protein VG309_00790 [Rhizomicrobium sp.]|jgi:hypothetical protein|nr:hypothetical protein [Rhizomicrobium sp.]